MKTQHTVHTLSRRDAIILIAGLPVSLSYLMLPEPPSPLYAEEFLAQCTAGITTCWHLMQESSFAVVESILQTYIPTLETLAQQPSRYQKTAASLTTQGYRLNGILALHHNNFRARDVYFQQAVQYSEIVENPSL
jgi:hypothetical protein